MIGDGFAGLGDSLDDSTLINRLGQGLADARIVKRGTGGVDPQEIGSEKIGDVEIGAFLEDRNEFRGDEFLVPDDIGLTGLIEV